MPRCGTSLIPKHSLSLVSRYSQGPLLGMRLTIIFISVIAQELHLIVNELHYYCYNW